MSQYDVYALGNALVDSEFKVDEETLKKLSIDKGHMTLIDDERMKEILAGISHSSDKKQSGGSAANTIIAFSQLGGKGFYCCKVAGDEDGKFYLEDLAENGVSHKQKIDSLPSDITGKCIVMVTPDAERSMSTYLGVTGRFSKDELDNEVLKKSKYLYIEGYLVTNPDAVVAIKDSIALAKKHGVKVALTLSDPGIVAHFKTQFKEILDEGVDLLFCNEEEALSIVEESDLEDAIEKITNIVPHFTVTLGSSGAFIFNDGERFTVDGFPVKAIDANGAGDMFAGAYMFGIMNDMSEQHAGKLACFLSSKVVSQFGPRLSKEQVLQSVHDFKENYLR